MARRTFTGTAQGVDVNTRTIANGIDYGVGFGMGDFRRAMADGYSARSVLDYLSGWNNPVGPSARQALAAEANRQYQEDLQIAAYKPPAYTPPPIPTPKALTTSATAVGGSAKGVKIKRSAASKSGSSSRGTRSLNRASRNRQMQINNLNLA
jgi:hypothetical protein|tara:strand:+ start:849 stop:1304 length:456 start_codon:yes stop_codon:yes gene_type:complete